MAERRVAIIGMAGRFPKAASVEALWNLVCAKKSGVTHFTEAELFDAGVPRRTLENPTYVRAGAILDGVSSFDADFFGISPAEAELMDPQQRIMLECAVEAFEQAGYDPRALEVPVGVFCGSSMSTYLLYNLLPRHRFAGGRNLPLVLGNDKDYIATSISYRLNLTGPSVAVQTACSTSLVAVHFAVQSLLWGECDMALAGGVTVRVPQKQGYHAETGGVASPDGTTRSFDADAQGTIFGNGCGVVLLKRLDDALRDRDPIDAVILGTAINNDGSAKAGFTAPSVKAQAQVIVEAQEVSGVDADSISLIEAHGTATALGDPIELAALTEAFQESTARRGFCAIGSVKSNVGHLEIAAGIAGLIKTVMALKARTLPPSLNYKTPNPQCRFDESPFYVNVEPRPWPATERPRVAGVSAFGIGGTNAHVIVQEAPTRDCREENATEAGQPLLIPISAKTPAALAELASRWSQFLATTREPLSQIAPSAAKRRPHYDQRLVLMGSHPLTMAGQAEAFVRGESREGLFVGARASTGRPRLAFVYPGQGGQWIGMGRRLFATESVFRDTLHHCDAVLASFGELRLLRELSAEPCLSRMDDIEIVQPAIFAIQVALTSLWRAYGVEPDLVIGHSLGEIAAAYASGALTLEDAAQIVTVRSRLLKRTRGMGSMAVVALPEAELATVLRSREENAVIAAVNGPRSTILAAPPAVMDELIEELERKRIFCRRVKTECASHCPDMDALLPDLRRALANLRPKPASTPFLSTVLTKHMDGPDLDAEYWCANLRVRVSFFEGIKRMLASGVDWFVELSPHATLVPAIEDAAEDAASGARVLSSMRRESDDVQVFREALAALYASGVPVNFHAMYPASVPFVRLPTYPWQRREYWVDGHGGTKEDVLSFQTDHDQWDLDDGLLGNALNLATENTQVWKCRLKPASSLLARGPRARFGHCVSAASWITMLVLAAEQATESRELELVQLSLSPPFELGAKAIDVQTTSQRKGDGCYEVQVSTAEPSDQRKRWRLRASGRAGSLSPSSRYTFIRRLQPQQAGVDRDAVYTRLALSGLSYPESERMLDAVAIDTHGVSAEFHAADNSNTAHAIATAIEAGLQLVHFSLALRQDLVVGQLTPVSVRRVVWERTPAGPWRADVRVHGSSKTVETELTIAGKDGTPWLTLDGILFAPTRSEQQLQGDRDQPFHEIRWTDAPLEEAPYEEKRRRWLILEGEDVLGPQVARRLRDAGDFVVRAVAGERFAQADRDTYTFDPTSAMSIAQLLRTVEETQPVAGIVNLLALEAQDWGDEGALSLAVEKVLRPALYLTQELTRNEREAYPRLFLLTRGAQPVLGVESVTAPVQAMLWGLSANLAQEHPELQPTAIDLDPNGGERIVERVVEELRHRSWIHEVAVRGDLRYRAKLVLSGENAEQAREICRPNRTYLVTGGLGAMGLKAAAWLHVQGARHLVLLGRRAPSPEAEHVLNELRSKGTRVSVLIGDIGHPADARRVFAHMEANMPPLAGLLHLASVMDDAIVHSMTWSRFLDAITPKVRGAYHLHTLTKEQTLDFFVLFSSVVSLTGSHGQSSYTAANRYLDALAHYRRARGLPALSVNWGAWNIERGQDLDPLTRERLRGVAPFAPDVAFDVLGRLLGSEAPPQVGFIPGLRLDEWLRHSPQALQLPFFDDVRPALKDPHRQADSASSPPRSPAERGMQWLSDCVRDEIAAALKLGPAAIEPDRPLHSLGLNSLLGLELRRSLERKFGLKLTSSIIYNYPTHEKLVRYLASKVGIATPVDGHSTKGGAKPEKVAVLDESELRLLSEHAAEAMLREYLAKRNLTG